MNHWSVGVLSDVLELQRGHDLPTQDRVDGDVPIIGSFGITGRHNDAKYDGPGVAIGRSGASIGTATFVAEPYWPLNTCLFVRDFKGNDARWIFHLLDSIDFAAFNSGSAQPSLNRNFLRDIPVLIPPNAEQRAISEVLGALDEKITANTKLSTSFDDYLGACFQRELASGFEAAALESVADVNAEAVKPVANESLRYIDIASVRVGAHTFPGLIPWENAPGRARRRVRRGDTLWSTVRPNRRSHSLNLSSDPALVGSTGLAVLSPRDVGFAYLYETTRLPEFTAYLENVAEGSAYPAVRAEQFKSAPVPLLPPERRVAFEELAAPMRENAHAMDEESRMLAELRDTLLPELMSGRLRAKDAEKQIEEVL